MLRNHILQQFRWSKIQSKKSWPLQTIFDFPIFPLWISQKLFWWLLRLSREIKRTKDTAVLLWMQFRVNLATPGEIESEILLLLCGFAMEIWKSGNIESSFGNRIFLFLLSKVILKPPKCDQISPSISATRKVLITQIKSLSCSQSSLSGVALDGRSPGITLRAFAPSVLVNI